MFSSSKSRSEAYDNRSIASETAIAAGGNRGSIARDIFGDKIFLPGSAVPWTLIIVVGIGWIMWKAGIFKRVGQLLKRKLVKRGR
jgi:hypothetical protein